MKVDWGPIGVGVTVLIALSGWVGALIERHRRLRPQLVFGPVELFGEGEHPRGRYTYAFKFKATNLGPGVASHCDIWFEDPEEVWTAEHVSNPALVPGDPLVDFAGIRAGSSQQLDPTEEEADAFLARCQLMCICWDQKNRLRLFFPGGPRYGLRTPRRGNPFPTPDHLAEFSTQFPSRGARGQSRGAGLDTRDLSIPGEDEE